MASQTREQIIAGNWKMYKTSSEASAFIRELLPLIKDAADAVYLAVPFTSIEAAAKVASGTSISVGAQNMYDAEAGAFTGEISAHMLKAAGASFVILGHSERRQLFGETDAFINRKVRRALQEGLRPLVCIGESLTQRDEGRTEEVLAQQLSGSLCDLSASQIARLVVAYEPIWAIGTGRHATPQIAQAAHRFIRDCLSERWGSQAADKTVLLYGGSVKPINASNLMAEPDIDGLLVGGAALEVDSFAQIVYHDSLVSGS